MRLDGVVEDFDVLAVGAGGVAGVIAGVRLRVVEVPTAVEAEGSRALGDDTETGELFVLAISLAGAICF